MPFTLSHIAAVLPIKAKFRDKFSSSGLIMGSMVPDFEYFLRYQLLGHYGHTIKGFFLFDIPVAFFIIFIFHSFVRTQLILHLPNLFFSKFIKYSDSKINSGAKISSIIVFISIIVGILTHFLWDGFTHDEEYYLASKIPFLKNSVPILNYKAPFYSILQISSSIFGLVYILYFILKLPNSELKENKNNIKNFWIAFSVLTLIFIFLRYWIGVPTLKPLGQLIVVICSSAMLSILIVSSIYKFKSKNG